MTPIVAAHANESGMGIVFIINEHPWERVVDLWTETLSQPQQQPMTSVKSLGRRSARPGKCPRIHHCLSSSNGVSDHRSSSVQQILRMPAHFTCPSRPPLNPTYGLRLSLQSFVVACRDEKYDVERARYRHMDRTSRQPTLSHSSM